MSLDPHKKGLNFTMEWTEVNPQEQYQLLLNAPQFPYGKGVRNWK